MTNRIAIQLIIFGNSWKQEMGRCIEQEVISKKGKERKFERRELYKRERERWRARGCI